MYKVAVCDDEKYICLEIAEHLRQIAPKLQEEFLITIFESGEELLSSLRMEEQFDFLILDISLRNMSGVEIGNWIREGLQDNLVFIICISAEREYAIQLFDMSPLGFLLKPINYTKLEELMKKGISLSTVGHRKFIFRLERECISVEINRIIYFEVQQKKIAIHLLGGRSYSFTSTLKQIEEMIKPADFARPHQAFLVNVRLVECWESTCLHMCDSTIIPIAQPKRAQMRKIRNRLGCENM